ncbi:hypothetical protein D3C87_616160 [compost metagenome]
MKKTKVMLGVLLSCLVAGQSAQAASTQYLMKAAELFPAAQNPDPGTPPDETTPPVTPPEPQGDPSAWMAFFHGKNTLTTISSLDEWGPRMQTASIVSKSLTNAVMPQTEFGVSKIGSLDLTNNRLTHVDFMQGVTGITGTLNLRMNPITTLSPMSGLTRLDHDVRIESTALTSLQGLQNVTYIRNLTFYDNKNLKDITALANVAAMDYGSADSTSQYTAKPPLGSPFCNGLDSGAVKVSAYSNGAKLTSAQLCQ